MALWQAHPRENLLRYLDSELGENETRSLEEHLTSCAACQRYATFVKAFNGRIGELAEDEFTSEEACPDSETLIAYEAGEVDEETARHLRVHLLFCDDCREEFYALRQLSQRTLRQELVEKLKEVAVELWKLYGPGALVGSIRIVAEQPAFAWRGEGPAEAISKVFEVAVGDNSYSIELRVGPDGALACNIAGFKAPHRAALEVSVHNESGDELFGTETDEAGNAEFVLEGETAPQGLCILALRLDDSESYLPFLVPEKSTTS